LLLDRNRGRAAEVETTVASGGYAADGISGHNIRQYSSRFIAGLCVLGEPYIQPGEKSALELVGADLHDRAILDLGGGDARTTPFLTTLGRAYLGLDPSPSMVELGRARFPAADIRLGDARAMPDIAGGAFGFVLFSNNAIDCLSWEDRRVALREIRRVTAPGGWFVFASHNRRALPIPRLWDPRPLFAAWSVANFPRRVVLFPGGIFNYLRLRGGARDNADHSVVHDAGEGLYNLFQVYVDAEKQVEGLRAAGFQLVGLFDLQGRPVPPGDHATCRSLWLTYVCRAV
jgi:SAM-dependent methyltransferase